MFKRPTLVKFEIQGFQRLWLERAYKIEGPVKEVEITKVVRAKLPKDFSPYQHLSNLWSAGQLSIFAIYKLNRDDKNLLALDKMFNALKDKFIDEPGRTYVTVEEFVLACKINKSIVEKIFNENLLYQFWHTPESGIGGVQHENTLKENVFSFSESKAVLKLSEYEGFEAQMEAQWQRLYFPPGFFGERKLKRDSAGGNRAESPRVDATIFSEPPFVDTAAPLPSKMPRKIFKSKKGNSIISIDEEGIFANWKGREISVNRKQGLLIGACIWFWEAKGRKPVVLKIDQIRDWAKDQSIPTVARAFSNHQLRALFRTRKAKGVFEFRP